MKKKRTRVKVDRLNEKHWCGSSYIIPEDDWKAPGEWVVCKKCKVWERRFYTVTAQVYPCVGGPCHGKENKDTDVIRGMGYELFNPSGAFGRCILVYIRDLENKKSV